MDSSKPNALIGGDYRSAEQPRSAEQWRACDVVLQRSLTFSIIAPVWIVLSLAVTPISHGAPREILRELPRQLPSETVAPSRTQPRRLPRCEGLKPSDIPQPRVNIDYVEDRGGWFQDRYRVTGSVEGVCLREAALYQEGRKERSIITATMERFDRFSFDLEFEARRAPEIRIYTTAGESEVFLIDTDERDSGREAYERSRYQQQLSERTESSRESAWTRETTKKDLPSGPPPRLPGLPSTGEARGRAEEGNSAGVLQGGRQDLSGNTSDEWDLRSRD